MPVLDNDCWNAITCILHFEGDKFFLLYKSIVWIKYATPKITFLITDYYWIIAQFCNSFWCNLPYFFIASPKIWKFHVLLLSRLLIYKIHISSYSWIRFSTHQYTLYFKNFRSHFQYTFVHFFTWPKNPWKQSVLYIC